MQAEEGGGGGGLNLANPPEGKTDLSADKGERERECRKKGSSKIKKIGGAHADRRRLN